MSEELDRKYFAHGQQPGSLELAFVGDSVYDLHIRRALVKKGGKVNALNRLAVQKVKASAQAQSLGRIYDTLSEDEKLIVRRAHNAKQTPTKSASLEDYTKATALEALIGYLYLTEQTERLNEILKLASEM